MSTKDPHVALIDAHEKLESIKFHVKQAIELVMKKRRDGTFTVEDKQVIKIIRAQAIEAAKRVQDELFEELKGHGLELTVN